MMQWVFISMLGVGVLLLLVSVILFVYWRIPSLMEELSGKRARKRKKHNNELGTGSTSGALSGSEYIKEMSSRNASVLESYSGIQEEKATDFENDSGSIQDSSNLAKMIEDPYGQVWGKKIQTESKEEIKEESPTGYQRKDKQDDMATDVLDENATGVLHRIIIIEEQSSLG